MKFWTRALNDLEHSDKTFHAVFDVIFSFEDNVFFERYENGRIKKMTYRECRRRICGAAAELIRTGIKGEFVGLCMDNREEWVISFWALLMAGCRPLLVNTRLPRSVSAALMTSAGVKAVVSDRPFEGFQYIDAVVLCTCEGECTPRWADEIALSSSGTSGNPKLCVYDGAAISAQIFNTDYVLKQNVSIKCFYKGQCKLLAFLPFYHVFGLIANLMWFSFFGRTFVFLNELSGPAITDACKRHGVTHVFAIPLLFNTVASSVRAEAAREGEKTAEKLKRGLKLCISLQSAFPTFGKWLTINVIMKKVRARVLGPAVRFCITGGGDIREDSLLVLNGLGYSLYNGYGMTEIGIGSVELRRPAKYHLEGSVGRPFPSMEYLVDDGKLFVRGQTLCCAVYTGGTRTAVDRSQWLNTGDLAKEENGNYFILGRQDDLIIGEGGENISPDLLERSFDLPYTREWCILGIADGQYRRTAMVLRYQDNATELQKGRCAAAFFAANASLPAGSRVSILLIAEEPLPSVMESKIMRRELERRILDGSFRCHRADGEAVPAEPSAEYSRVLAGVIEVFASVFDKQPSEISESSHFVYDLSGNSLQYFTLLEQLSSRFNTQFQIEQTICSTPAEFAAFIVRR